MAHSPGFDRLRRLFALGLWADERGLSAAEAAAAFETLVIDRRTMLRGVAATAALAVVPTGLQGCASKPAVKPDLTALGKPGSTSVAVIGGGIAGLHCGHRLKVAGFDVTVYEAQQRTGGRMWTSRDKFENLTFEIGGELIDSNHATMIALAKEFGITLDDRWAAEPDGMTRETWFVGGKRIDNATLLQQTIAIAPVMSAQVQAAESDEAAMKTYNEMTMQAWLDQYVPVAMYPELHQTLAVAFVGEYGLEADQQSALNLHYLFGIDSTEEFLIFGDSDERWHTHGGNDLITTALASALGGAVRTGSRLVKAAGPTAGPFALTFEGSDGAFTVTADRLVFALPFTLLRKVDLADLALSAEKRKIISEMGYGTNAKVMGEFSSRPWWTEHNESGLLTTDLGVQQGWDTTIGQDAGARGVWTNFLGGNQGMASGEGTAAEWFGGVLPDLETIWPGSKDAWTGNAERMHWPTFQWSQGSYTCYRPGQWEFWSREGVREQNVHFCGEHCSQDFQGWMEGGAETGALVAAEILDDFGVSHSPALSRLVEPKVVGGHACYHGDRERPAWKPRVRRLLDQSAVAIASRG